MRREARHGLEPSPGGRGQGEGERLPGLAGVCPRPFSFTPGPRPPPPGNGFALPAAIFLLVVLGGLAAWLTSLTQATLAESNLELEGERAYQAARAGLEAGIHQAAQAGAGCAQITQSVTFPAHSSLERFRATVSCQQHLADEGGASITVFEITSIACNQPNGGACPNASPTLAEYAERHMAANVVAGL